MAPILSCPKCGRVCDPRPIDALASAIMHYAIRLRSISEAEARYELRQNLRLLLAELDGYCSNHQWEMAAAAAPQVPTEQEIEDRRLHVCQIIGIDRGRQ